MSRLPTKLLGMAMVASAAIALGTDAALAQEAQKAAPDFETQVKFIFNTLNFLVMGFLVMWMAAGFAMLEAGLVRTKNVSMQLTKNIALYSIAGIMYWLIGYNLMYSGVDGGFFGTPGPVMLPDPAAEQASLAGENAPSYAAASDWFFQMVFVATAASIVSGTMAERIKLWPFLIFVVVLTGVLYPITGAWKWGGGWLDKMGFQDFAGSTLVHSVGGWAALAGAILLGPRLGKYGKDGSVHPIPGSSMPLATLGTFILWLGWFGFNGGSQLAMDSAENVSAIARIFVNTNLAAAAGAVVALILTQIIYGKVDITMVLNGALAGLVSITAEPLAPSIPLALFVGAVGGVIVVIFVPLLDKLKIDDVVGAIPVHLIAGIWGTIAVAFSNADASFATQLIGIVAIGAFTFIVSLVIWAILKFTIGIRVSEEEEIMGLDAAEIGVEAYPEFGKGSQAI
jgi:Amt family ammonium transporter